MITHKPLGICPACGETVAHDAPDVVWTCPSDLNDANPYHEALPDDWQRSEAAIEASGYFANCPEGNFDAPPQERLCPIEAYGTGHLPLHAVCYERGEY